MSASYAHYRFGKLLLPQLPSQVRQCVGRFRRMYDMGLMGPDILFYCNPLMKNTVSQLCDQYHSQSGRDFFPAACAKADTEAAQAYLYGLLAHYCLDAATRSFLKRQDPRLEAEFDRYLMALDGIAQPHTLDFSPRLKLTRGECMTAACFYPPATGGNISACVRNLRQICKLSASKNREKREALLRKFRPSLCDLLMPQEPIPELQRADSELLARFNHALKDCPALMEQLLDHIRTGAELGEAFAPNFDAL